MGTCTLGQSVWENSTLFFLQGNFRVQFFCLQVAPHSGRGERPQQHMCCRPVCCLLAFFLETLRNFFTNVCTCAHLRMCLLHFIHASSFALTH